MIALFVFMGKIAFALESKKFILGVFLAKIKNKNVRVLRKGVVKNFELQRVSRGKNIAMCLVIELINFDIAAFTSDAQIDGNTFMHTIHAVKW